VEYAQAAIKSIVNCVPVLTMYGGSLVTSASTFSWPVPEVGFELLELVFIHGAPSCLSLLAPFWASWRGFCFILVRNAVFRQFCTKHKHLTTKGLVWKH
jgi:hypothetical protein